MIWNICFVLVGGFLGAMARFLVNQLSVRIFSYAFPYGTLSVNIAGSFLLGLFIGFQVGDSYMLLLGIGFLGAFTTFSTLNLEIVHLALEKRWVQLWVYLSATYILGILFAFIGFIMST